jgi:hypothetical protein
VATKTVRDEVVGVRGKFRVAVQNGIFVDYARYIRRLINEYTGLCSVETIFYDTFLDTEKYSPSYIP